MNPAAKRISLMAQLGTTFHIGELATLWNITNPNTLRVTLKRYTDAGALFRVYRGLYSLTPSSKIDHRILAVKSLHTYCYISTETILYENGYISQPPRAITLVSHKSVRTKIGQTHVHSRQLDEKFLLQPPGIIFKGAIMEATAERAIADMLYFNPQFHFDKIVDWDAVQKLQNDIGYPLTPRRYAR